MSSKLSHKAYVIGAGITIMDLDMHGENGGESASTVQRQYGDRELGDDAGFVNRGGRMLNEESYENLRDVLSVVPSRRERLQAHAIRQQRSIPVGEADELRRHMNRMILEFSRIQTLAGIIRSAYNQYTPIAEDMRNPPSALLWKQATEHFHDLGNPDKFVGDRAQSEWTSFTVTTSSHELINEMSRITKQLPGNALNKFVDSNVLLSIVVHHQSHYHAQTRDHGQRRKFDSQPHAFRLAFIGQFAELPFDMVFTEQYSVRCAQVAVYKFLGIPEDKLTKMHHYEKDPKVLAKATVTMFR